MTKAQEHGIKIVKEVKGGLNPSSVSQLEFGGPYVGDVTKIAIIVAVVGLMVGLSISFVHIIPLALILNNLKSFWSFQFSRF